MSRKSMFRIGVAAMMVVLLTAGALSQGVLKNGGTFTNTGTATYTTVQNYKTAAGTLVNSGTLTTTGNLTNTNGSGLNGTVRNYSGSSHGRMIVGGTLTNDNASFDNDNAGEGVLKVGGTVSNTGGAIDTDSGKVEYNGTGAQSVLALTYGKLFASGGNTKTMSGTVTVRDSFSVGGSTTFAMNATTDSLALLGIDNVNGGTFTSSGGAVNYGADTAQAIIAGQYLRLWLTGATVPHAKTAAGSVTFAASGSLSVGANEVLELTSGTLNLSTNSPSFTNSNIVQLSGSSTASFHTGIENAGTFLYAATVGNQNIGAVTYNTLRLLGASTKTFPANDSVAVLTDYVVDGGTGARTYTDNTFQFAGTGSQNIAGLDSTQDKFYVLQFKNGGAKTIAAGSTLQAARMDVLSTSGTVTNDGSMLLTGISNVGLTVAANRSLTNSATGVISVVGADIENDGTITNAGTVTVE